ncbi:hypothetical protein ACHQM5_016273 [Ranunculus cassubicifolius]
MEKRIPSVTPQSFGKKLRGDQVQQMLEGIDLNAWPPIPFIAQGLIDYLIVLVIAFLLSICVQMSRLFMHQLVGLKPQYLLRKTGTFVLINSRLNNFAWDYIASDSVQLVWDYSAGLLQN